MEQKKPPPQPYNGPNFQGFTFTLKSISTNPPKPNHILVILTQATETFENHRAIITGTWQGENPTASDPTPKSISGYISDFGGTLSINFGWNDKTGGKNTLNGTLTYTPQHAGVGMAVGAVIPATATLTGLVTVSGSGTGPGNVTGVGS